MPASEDEDVEATGAPGLKRHKRVPKKAKALDGKMEDQDRQRLMADLEARKKVTDRFDSLLVRYEEE